MHCPSVASALTAGREYATPSSTTAEMRAQSLESTDGINPVDKVNEVVPIPVW